MMTNQNQLRLSKTDKCPLCYRKLCLRSNYSGKELIEIKHKGSLVLAEKAVVRCIGCKTQWVIDSTKGIIGRFNSESEQE